MKMKVKINKYIFSLFRPPFFGKTKRRLPGNSLPMSHNIFYSLPMRFLICDDVRLAHRRGESSHLRRRNMQAGCGGVTLGVERKVACPEQIVHRSPGLGRVPRDGLENIAALAVTLDMPLLAATLHHLQMLQLNRSVWGPPRGPGGQLFQIAQVLQNGRIVVKERKPLAEHIVQNIIAPDDEGITHRFHLMRHNPKSAALPKTLQALPSRFFVA